MADPAIGEVREVKCIACGEVKECVYEADPFASEMGDDDTPVWECSDCRYELAMDI